MKIATEQRPTLKRDEIAKVAWQLWQQEGGQPSRDVEYWLEAEQLLLVASRQGNGPTNHAIAKPNVPAASVAAAKGKKAGPSIPASRLATTM